jgi:hypothetical protein
MEDYSPVVTGFFSLTLKKKAGEPSALVSFFLRLNGEKKKPFPKKNKLI